MGIAGAASNIKKRDINLVKALADRLYRYKNDLEIYVCYDPESLPMYIAQELSSKGLNVKCFACNEEEESKARELGLEAINLNRPRIYREIEFIKSIDKLIVCGGGSGTLMEVTFAYQMNKPVLLLRGIKGSVEPFRGKFLDKRKRFKIKSIGLDSNIKKALGI